MKPSLTTTLCTQCGLCCDGSLFADVELAGEAEATQLEIMGLNVEGDDADRELLLQPCAALEARRCAIYAHRPKCCQSFECQLLRRVRRGAVSAERAAERIAETQKRIQQVRALLAQLGQRNARLPLKERCAEALAGGACASPEMNRMRDELAAAMSAVEKSIRRTFLGNGGQKPRCR